MTLARGNLAMGLFLIPALLEVGSGVVSERHRLGQAAGRAEAEGWMFPSQAASLSLSVSPPVGREAVRFWCPRSGHTAEVQVFSPQVSSVWEPLGVGR